MITQQAYSGLKGVMYTPGREIGRGGEGAVFEVKENPALVIKVYTQALDAGKAAKLQYMASVQDTDLLKFAAWPLDVLRNARQRICGLVMKKLEGFMPLHMLFSPMDRKRLFPDKGYNFLIHVARNLSTAFYKLHQLGIIMGDVNEANILVNTSGMVALIDCDSFQIRNGNEYYFCEVGIPRYTPPELLELGSFDKVVRTVNTDAFSLATLIFQLLFLGRPPFTGVNLTKEDIDEEKAIRTHEFAYSLRRTNKKLNPARNSFELKNLTPGIIDLFHRAFELNTPRPVPKEWVAELDALSRELVTCTYSKLHLYPKQLQECPWCSFKNKQGILYFLDDTYLKGFPELNDIDQFINGFKLENIKLKRLSVKYVNLHLKPAPIDPAFKKAMLWKWVIIVVLLALTAAILLYPDAYVYSPIPLLALLRFWTSSPYQKKLKLELADRQVNLMHLETQLGTLVEQHNQPHDLIKYNQTATHLTSLISRFKSLPDQYTLRKKKAEEAQSQQQYQQYLRQFAIGQHAIPSFGPAKKQLLYNHSIYTAADISKLQHTKVSGIGPAYTQKLEAWQRQIGAGFTPTFDYNQINRELAIAKNEIIIEKRQLEIDIKKEYQALHYLRTNIMTSVTALERQYTSLGERMYQAKLDYEAFEKLLKWWK